MEILIADSSYDNPELTPGAFNDNLRAELKKIHPDFELRDANIGEGADWPVVVATFAGLFLLGDKIEKNLSAWLSLASKVFRFVEDAAKRFGTVRVDSHGAKLLSIQRIVSAEHDLRVLEHLTEQRVVLRCVSWNDQSCLEGIPDALYIHIFRVNDERLYVVGTKSYGDLAFLQTFSTDPRHF